MIRVEGLGKRYGQTTALQSISFEIPPGQICGYLGPNGAGKSTTVRILSGVLRAGSGRAEVAGFDVAECPLDVKRRIGYVPEHGPVYSTLSVNEYLALVGALHQMDPEEVDQRAAQMLRLFDIHEAGDRRLDTLSKGMRQKAVITAALIHDPEVLLLDEPLTGLDVNAASVIKDLVRGMAEQGKTILYCSHILDVVERLCERVVILNRGEIVADGPTAEVVTEGQKGSLEEVFRDLTGDTDHDEVVKGLIDTVHCTSVEVAAGATSSSGPGKSRSSEAQPSQSGKSRSRGKRKR